MGAESAMVLVSVQAEHGGPPEPGGPCLATVAELESLLVRDSLLAWESRQGSTDHSRGLVAYWLFSTRP